MHFDTYVAILIETHIFRFYFYSEAAVDFHNTWSQQALVRSLTVCNVKQIGSISGVKPGALIFRS